MSCIHELLAAGSYSLSAYFSIPDLTHFCPKQAGMTQRYTAMFIRIYVTHWYKRPEYPSFHCQESSIQHVHKMHGKTLGVSSLHQNKKKTFISLYCK